MKYYIIAGEASGDLHASNLMKQIKDIDKDAEFRFWGGDKMNAQGGFLVNHYKNIAFMGFWEVLTNVRLILKAIDYCKKDIVAYRPHLVIFVDYPGFNLRVARFTHEYGFTNMYYISPQVWAWKSSRVTLVKEYISRMVTILPFEQKFYKQYSINVDYVGHPLLDAIEEFRNKTVDNTIHSDKKICALLPGSRVQEIKMILPVMLNAIEKHNDFHFVIAAAPSVPKQLYTEIIGNRNIEILENKTYELLSRANCAIVTSGTATLETALFNVPMVVCYKGSRFSYMIAKWLVKLNYISLVNLIMEERVVEELIQENCTSENISKQFELLNEEKFRNRMLGKFEILKTKLGNSGASKRAAIIACKLANVKMVEQ